MNDPNLVRAPRQNRSEKTMGRILDAFDCLIQERPYDAITIADIARKAETGSSSIYARFKDKRAILVQVHERVRERATRKFEDLCRPDAWDDVPIDRAMHEIIGTILKWYRENHNVMKAALLLNDSIIYTRIGNTLHAGAVQLSYLIQDRIPGQNRRSAARSADFIFRIMTATFQQSVIFDQISPTMDDLHDEEIVEGLVKASFAQFESADQGR